MKTLAFVVAWINTQGAYHLKENFGNSGWKVNGMVDFRKFQPKIEEYALRQSFHSGWYEPNGMLLTINQFLGSFSVPDSRFTNSPPFWIQTVTDVAWHFYGKLVNRLPLYFRHPNRIFLSNGKHPQCTDIWLVSWLIVLFEPYGCTNAITFEQRWKTSTNENEGDCKKKTWGNNQSLSWKGDKTSNTNNLCPVSG